MLNVCLFFSFFLKAWSFVTYLMEVSEESREGLSLLKWLERRAQKGLLI